MPRDEKKVMNLGVCLEQESQHETLPLCVPYPCRSQGLQTRNHIVGVAFGSGVYNRAWWQ